MQATDDFEALLAEARAGERDAWARLLRQVYGDLRRLAHHHLRNGQTMPTLSTTGLVSEWYLRLCGSGRALPNDRQHFFALAGRIMRQVICGYARERLAFKRGGQAVRVDECATDNQVIVEADSLCAMDHALTLLADTNPDIVRVVECRFFAGMTEAETAEVIGSSERTVRRLWSRARNLLADALEP